MQEAPGVGFALAYDHITVAVQLANGSRYDEMVIPGSESYVSSMAALCEFCLTGDRTVLSQRFASGPAFDVAACAKTSDSAISHSSTIEGLTPMAARDRPEPTLQLRFQRTVSTASPPTKAIELLMPISDMLRDTYRSVARKYSLKYNHVYVSFPDFVNPKFRQIDHILDQVVERAGLRSHGSMRTPQSRATLNESYSINNCWYDKNEPGADNPDECENYNDRTIRLVLGIGLSDEIFSLHLMPRNTDGMFYFDESLTRAFPSQGMKQAEQDAIGDDYWDWMRNEMTSFLGTNSTKIDLLVLHGSQATHQGLQQLLQGYFEANNNIKQTDYLRAPEDHIFAAARSMASAAKQAMWDGLDGCIPPTHCPYSEYFPSALKWYIPDENKDEL